MTFRPIDLGPRPRHREMAALYDDLVAKGIQPTRRASPDFLAIFPNGGLALICVKFHRGRRAKVLQRWLMESLSKYSIPCFHWSSLDGYREVLYTDTAWTPKVIPPKATRASVKSMLDFLNGHA